MSQLPDSEGYGLGGLKLNTQPPFLKKVGCHGSLRFLGVSFLDGPDAEGARACGLEGSFT